MTIKELARITSEMAVYAPDVEVMATSAGKRIDYTVLNKTDGVETLRLCHEREPRDTFKFLKAPCR